MLTLLSPAKKLLDCLRPFFPDATQPIFTDKANELAQIMKKKSQSEISALMALSQDLAQLNYERYQHFDLNDNPKDRVTPALFLFQGDVYQGLEADKWSEKDIQFAQSHLAILSGLYGLLKPLDLIQPYRLEMGVRLANPKGKTLYDFWHDALLDEINKQLSNHLHPVLINLASTEYFKAIDVKKIKYPILTINFYERKNNQTKMIGIYSKKARGAMAKYLMCHHIDTTDEIKNFHELGYRFSKETSSAGNFDFIRTH